SGLPGSPRSCWGEAALGRPPGCESGRDVARPRRRNLALSGARLGARGSRPPPAATDRVRAVAQPYPPPALLAGRGGGGAAPPPAPRRRPSRRAVGALGLTRRPGVLQARR